MTEICFDVAIDTAITPPARSIEFSAPLALPQLPTLFRVTRVSDVLLGDGCVACEATLFNEAAQLTVCWTARQRDPRIRHGALVSPRWPVKAAQRDGRQVVSRLVPIERAEAGVNLFRTVPSGWVKDRELVRRAIALCEQMPTAYCHLFNAVLWDGDRFRRFCRSPSSKNGHHNVINGNLEHTLQTAEHLLRDCADFARSNAGLAILAALLHDAGKADEYRLDRDGLWTLTERGRLLGHRVTVVEWIAAALATHRIALPARARVALLHCLTASPGAPQHLGIRPPLMFEAIALSASDRLSGAADLLERCAPQGEGLGRYHRHLGGQAYCSDPA